MIFVLVCFIRLALASESFPLFTPVQILRPSESHNGLEVTEHLARLLDSSMSGTKLSIVGVVGPYHSGKSFLLNALIGRTDIFSVGPKTSPETRGIWLCRTDRKSASGEEIWLLDSEGFFGPRVPESYDAKIFTVSALLSSHILYNSVKVIDQQAVDMLETLTRQAQLFSVKTEEPTELENSFLMQNQFPPLTWIVEDFVQEEGRTSNPDDFYSKWVRSFMAKDEVPILYRVFPNLEVKTLFLPATGKFQLQDLSKLSWDELTPEFRSEISRLRLSLFDSIKSKSWGGSAKALVNFVQFVVSGLNKGMFPELPSLWQVWQNQVGEASARDAFSLFDRDLSTLLDKVPLPHTCGRFETIAGSAHSKSIDFFSQLVRDFPSGKEPAHLRRLQDLMRSRYRESLQRQDDRVKDYVEKAANDSISALKRDLDMKIGRQIPMNADELKSTANKLASEYVTRLTNLQRSYNCGSENQLPIPADWPRAAFSGSVNSIETLKNDATAAIESLSTENDRRLLQVVKNAATTALKNLEDKLIVNSEELLGTAELRDMSNSLIAETLSLFEEDVIMLCPWLKVSDIFIQHRKLVESEGMGRLLRFKQSHDARVNEWFRKTTDRILGEYRENKRQIELSVLPAEEAKLSEDHGHLLMSAQERLAESAGKISDSPSFTDSKARIEQVGKSEWDRLRRKNVELWKVHSDEATTCALELNKQYRKDNCMSGWFCLFALFPASHKTVSYRHLQDCFDKGSRMPNSMRQAVFEIWYEKDLIKEVGEVSKNMFVTGLAIALPSSMLLFKFLTGTRGEQRQVNY